MLTLRQLSLSLILLSLILVSVSAQTETTNHQQTATTKTNIIIERQLVRFITQAEAVEWRLVITNQQAEVVFDSGLVYGLALEWPLKNQQDELVQSGLYAYTLTTKATTDEAPRTQHGHLIVDRASSSDRVWLTSTQPVGLGADSAALQVTISGSREATVGGAELPSGAPQREASAAAAELPKRDTEEINTAKAVKPTTFNISGNGTTNRLTKWSDGPKGVVGDSLLSESGSDLVHNGNNIQLTAAASNQMETNLLYLNTTDKTMGILAGSVPSYSANNGPFFALRGNSYATVAGQRGSFTISAGNVSSPSGTEGSIKFNTGNDQVQMVIKPSGNVGLGTTTPLARLHVAGDIQSLALWQQLTAYAPNVIAGFVGSGGMFSVLGNRVTAGVVGATIGGGGYNGTLNYPSGGSSSGDKSNRVTDWFGTVGGGLLNVAGNNNGTLDDAPFATVSGGNANIASGLFSTVGGGFSNIASGDAATVPGGGNNTAQGDYSFAAGNQAQANHRGAFVWADGTGANFASTGNNQFLIHAAGGVGIGLNNPSEQLHVSGNIRATGNVCAVNLACASDARLKEQITSLHYGLSHLLQLRPVSWKWKDPAMQQLPMGLIAQEVEGVIPELILRDADPAKPLGLNYLGLVPVMIKAIQEQQDIITTLKAETTTLKQQNAALQRREAELDARFTVLAQMMQELKGQLAQSQQSPLKGQQ